MPKIKLNLKIDYDSRNLYIIKTTLDSFGVLQLPSNLDVLRRALCLICVEKKSNDEAFSKIKQELIDLFSMFSIPIESDEIVNNIKDLIDDYNEIRRALTIYGLTKKQKKLRKNEIMELFRDENLFVDKMVCIQLNIFLNIY